MKTNAPPLKIAFLAANALHDNTSGAALSLLTMLRALARRGWDCRSLTATVFDVPPQQPEELVQALEGWGLQIRGQIKGTHVPLWHGSGDGVSHTLMQTNSKRRLALSPMDELLFLNLARSWMAEIKPDVVLTFGGMVLDGALRRAAREFGATVVFYLANPSYNNRYTFMDVDRIITNSSVTAQLYAERLKVKAENVGLYVDPGRFVAAERRPDYVTFINPVGEKGVALFLRLVMMAKERAPDMRFLVVESRGTVSAALQRLNLDPALAERIATLPRQQDMREVYKQTRVLLVPSFWFEAAGRVLIEAVANGIPVIATDRGGIPETLAGGGMLLDVPPACVSNYWHMPTEEEADPWWQALHALHADPEHYQTMEERARVAGQTHDLGVKSARLDGILREAVARRRARSKGTAPAGDAGAAGSGSTEK